MSSQDQDMIKMVAFLVMFYLPLLTYLDTNQLLPAKKADIQNKYTIKT